MSHLTSPEISFPQSLFLWAGLTVTGVRCKLADSKTRWGLISRWGAVSHWRHFPPENTQALELSLPTLSQWLFLELPSAQICCVIFTHSRLATPSSLPSGSAQWFGYDGPSVVTLRVKSPHTVSLEYLCGYAPIRAKWGYSMAPHFCVQSHWSVCPFGLQLTLMSWFILERYVLDDRIDELLLLARLLQNHALQVCLPGRRVPYGLSFCGQFCKFSRVFTEDKLCNS